MDIITGYTGKPHVTSEQDRDVNIGITGDGSYVMPTGQRLAAEVSSNNEIRIRDGVIMHQGCAASIKKNTYDPLTIINGSQGMKRIDLIVARYQNNVETGVESLKLLVLQGTPADSDPAVPTYIEGDIQAGDTVADMPLYQVIIEGLNITEVKKVFKEIKNLDELNSNITNSTNYSFSETVWANPTYSIIKKNGRIDISYYCVVSGGVAAKEFPIARLPQGIIPSSAIQFAGWVADTTGNRHAASIKIATTGLISLIAGSNFVEAGFAISYPV